MTTTRERTWSARQVEQAHGLPPETIESWCRAHQLAPPPGPTAGAGGARVWPRAALEGYLHRLLSARQVAELLGWNPDVPRQDFFAAADVRRPVRTGKAGRPAEYWWHLITVIRFDLRGRPGPGLRAGAPVRRQALPHVPDGSPDDLLVSAQAAALLGFSSVASFNSSRRQGNLPALAVPDEPALPVPGRKPQAAWKRSTVEAAARQRGHTAALPGSPAADGELLDEDAVAAALGYTGTASLRTARRAGRVHGLDEPDALAPPGPRGGRPRPLYRAERVRAEQQRRAAAAHTAAAGEPDKGGRLLPADEAAALLGYTSARAFHRAVREGREPHLTAPDATLPAAGGRGRPRAAYREARIRAALAARTTP